MTLDVTTPPAPAATLVSVEGVSRSFGTLEVLREIALQLAEGELVALLGPSGSGKTTLVRMIAGADTAPSGRVTVAGELMPSLAALPKIGYMAQSDALYQELSGRENLSFFGRLFGLRGASLKAAIERCVELVELQDALDRPMVTYSGGMKRRLSLAVALLHSPRVLLLDEPTVGLDPVLRMKVWKELRGLADTGTAVLVTTHVMDEATECDRVCMLRGGRIIADDSPRGLMDQAGGSSLQDAFLHFALGGDA